MKHKPQNSKHRSILVTDSGLGGLSVFNDIANRLKKSSPWQEVSLTYFNAWPAPHRGYNHFSSMEKRARIFSNAMDAMEQYHPDQILIACNTLSVIYPHTRFAGTSQTRVEGIIDHGVQMIHEKLTADPDSAAVVFGTPATTNARTHENELLKLGIEKKRIINVGCTNLAGYIEREPFSSRVNRMIHEFVKEAVSKLGTFDGRVYAALCCTHFGYRETLFKEAFDALIPGRALLLNPNVRMARKVCEPVDQAHTFQADINIYIVSQAVWEDEQIQAYIRLLDNISPAARKALEQYDQNDRLFSVD